MGKVTNTHFILLISKTKQQSLETSRGDHYATILDKRSSRLTKICNNPCEKTTTQVVAIIVGLNYKTAHIEAFFPPLDPIEARLSSRHFCLTLNPIRNLEPRKPKFFQKSRRSCQFLSKLSNLTFKKFTILSFM